MYVISVEIFFIPVIFFSFLSRKKQFFKFKVKELHIYCIFYIILCMYIYKYTHIYIFLK